MEEVDGSQDGEDDDAEVQGHEVAAREEAGKGVEPEDVDGAVDGQEDEERAREVDVSLPHDGPNGAGGKLLLVRGGICE